jgi:hypothetical protein
MLQQGMWLHQANPTLKGLQRSPAPWWPLGLTIDTMDTSQNGCVESSSIMPELLNHDQLTDQSTAFFQIHTLYGQSALSVVVRDCSQVHSEYFTNRSIGVFGKICFCNILQSVRFRPWIAELPTLDRPL